MGRDRMRVLISAIASLALIVAGALVMDWYRLSFEAPETVGIGMGTVQIDLRAIRVCQSQPIQVCASAPLTPLPGMFPTLATLTLWSSLGFIALVAFQAGARILTGSANEALTRLGYMFSLMTISITVATAYLFGPETDSASIGVAAQMGITLLRTWGPLTLLAGLTAGFTALYMAVAPDSSDLAAEYKPLTIAPATALSSQRTRTPSVRIRLHEHTGAHALASREPTATDHAAVTEPGPRERTATSLLPAAFGPASGSSPSLARTQTGQLRPMPEHLRNRLSYVALTAELTGGGIDARREDGTSRLVLWRDVVGVVVRRMPAAYDGATFVDVVSTAGSTLRILPWTRITGERPVSEGEDRPRSLVQLVLSRCPGTKLDPATGQFLETREAAQLPDLETLQAHDARLA